MHRRRRCGCTCIRPYTTALSLVEGGPASPVAHSKRTCSQRIVSPTTDEIEWRRQRRTGGRVGPHRPALLGQRKTAGSMGRQRADDRWGTVSADAFCELAPLRAFRPSGSRLPASYRRQAQARCRTARKAAHRAPFKRALGQPSEFAATSAILDRKEAATMRHKVRRERDWSPRHARTDFSARQADSMPNRLEAEGRACGFPARVPHSCIARGFLNGNGLPIPRSCGCRNGDGAAAW